MIVVLQKTPGMIGTRLPARRAPPCVRAQDVDTSTSDPKFSFKSNSRAVGKGVKCEGSLPL